MTSYIYDIGVSEENKHSKHNGHIISKFVERQKFTDSKRLENPKQ
jgi:hypothetical protein